MTNKITEYLVYGYSGPTASDYCEEIITAKTPEEAKYYFIRSMKDDPTLWGRMGENNVHVREYVPAKARKELSGVLTRDWDPDGHTLAEVAAQMETYNGMIVAMGGISGSGRVEYEEDEMHRADWILKITYKRLENDAEYDKRRIAEDKKAKSLKASAAKVIASKETKERKEYVRLKKKFGDT
jgi:hypothetical protein